MELDGKIQRTHYKIKEWTLLTPILHWICLTREYDFSAHMLKQVGVSSVRLMTNPLKIDGLVSNGIRIEGVSSHHGCMQDQQPLSLYESQANETLTPEQV